MGMTIDDNVDFLNEAKDFFEDVANDPKIKETVKTYCIIESLETAITTMRKYQRMQAIVEAWKADVDIDSFDCMADIYEVVGDGND